MKIRIMVSRIWHFSSSLVKKFKNPSASWQFPSSSLSVRFQKDRPRRDLSTSALELLSAVIFAWLTSITLERFITALINRQRKSGASSGTVERLLSKFISYLFLFRKLAWFWSKKEATSRNVRTRLCETGFRLVGSARSRTKRDSKNSPGQPEAREQIGRTVARKKKERERETEAHSNRKRARERNDKYSSTLFLSRHATKLQISPETRRWWNVETLQIGLCIRKRFPFSNRASWRLFMPLVSRTFVLFLNTIRRSSWFWNQKNQTCHVASTTRRRSIPLATGDSKTFQTWTKIFPLDIPLITLNNKGTFSSIKSEVPIRFAR